MALKQLSWRCSNRALFLFSLLLVPTYLFSADPSASAAAVGAGDGIADASASVCDWMGGGHTGEKGAMHYYEVTKEDGASGASASFEDDTVLPDHVVRSCLSNMPPILQGIHTYLKSPDSEDPERVMPAFHRFLLAGPPGTSKSTTSLAIAQDLGVPKEVHEAASFLGEFRSHTAINLQKLFHRLLAEVKRKVVIINEADRLFEKHANTHTDHADSAHMVWSFLDQIERKNPNIIIIWAVNHPERLPVEMKSRFRVQYAYLPLIDTEKWLSRVGFDLRQRRGIRVAFSQISVGNVGALGSKAEQDGTAIIPDIDELRKAVGDKLSYRDLALVNDTIVIFAYNDHNPSAGGDIEVTDYHLAQALIHFLDKNKVLNYSAEQESDEARQDRYHRELLAQQERHFQSNNTTGNIGLGMQGAGLVVQAAPVVIEHGPQIMSAARGLAGMVMGGM